MLDVQPYLANIPIPILPWLVLYQCYILNIPLAAFLPVYYCCFLLSRATITASNMSWVG